MGTEFPVRRKSRQKKTARRWSREERRYNRGFLQRRLRNGEIVDIPFIIDEVYDGSRRDARKFLLYT